MTVHVHENGGFYVVRVKPGHFEVYRPTSTHAVRCAIVSHSKNPAWALQRAVAECDRRAADICAA